MAGGAGEVPAEAGSVSSHTAAQRWIQLPLCRHPDRRLNQPQSHTVTAGTGNTHSTPWEPWMTSMNEWFMSIYVFVGSGAVSGYRHAHWEYALCAREEADAATQWNHHAVTNHISMHSVCVIFYLLIISSYLNQTTQCNICTNHVYLFTCYV